MTRKSFSRLEVLVLSAIAVIALPSSLWMLMAPYSWYQNFPGRIPDFGEFNVHFVRDLGSVYLTWSVACIWAARSAAARFPIVALAALFFCLHALVHVFETLRGYIHADHFLLDFPLTYLPAILLLWVLYSCSRKPE